MQKNQPFLIIPDSYCLALEKHWMVCIVRLSQTWFSILRLFAWTSYAAYRLDTLGSIPGILSFHAAERTKLHRFAAAVKLQLRVGKKCRNKADCSLRQGAGGTEFASLGSRTCFLR